MKWQCGYVVVCVQRVGVCSLPSNRDSRPSSIRRVKGNRDLTQVHTHTYSTGQQAQQATLIAKHSAGPSINICLSVFEGKFLDQREKDGYVLDSANTKPWFTKRHRAFICKKEIIQHKAVHFMLQKTLMYVMQLEPDNIGIYLQSFFSGNIKFSNNFDDFTALFIRLLSLCH